MKNIIKKSSVILLMTAISTPLLAEKTNDISAVIGMSYGEQRLNTSDDPDGGVGSIRHEFARVAFPVFDDYVIQLDAERETYNQSGDDVAQSSSAIGFHASYKIQDTGLVGLFYARGIAESEDSENEDGWLTGLEGQYYFGDEFTLYGQAGVGRIRVDDHEGFLEDGRFGKIALRYFPLEDTMIEFTVAKAAVNAYIDGNDDGKFISYGLKAETRLIDSMPLYGVATYRVSRFDATTEDDLTKDTALMLGVSYRFGVSSLRDNDRNGVTLDMPMQPIRAAGFTEGLD